MGSVILDTYKTVEQRWNTIFKYMKSKMRSGLMFRQKHMTSLPSQKLHLLYITTNLDQGESNQTNAVIYFPKELKARSLKHYESIHSRFLCDRNPFPL